jgi:hypothetical protein
MGRHTMASGKCNGGNSQMESKNAIAFNEHKIYGVLLAGHKITL